MTALGLASALCFPYLENSLLYAFYALLCLISINIIYCVQHQVGAHCADVTNMLYKADYLARREMEKEKKGFMAGHSVGP